LAKTLFIILQFTALLIWVETAFTSVKRVIATSAAWISLADVYLRQRITGNTYHTDMKRAKRLNGNGSTNSTFMSGECVSSFASTAGRSFWMPKWV
jgi:hypothetical protein